MCFFYRDNIISNRPISAANSSWEDFRTTAPLYFCMGSSFPIELAVFGHSVHRFRGVKGQRRLGRVVKLSKIQGNH